ncbi:hypothetical protein JQ557_04150 [Bradyrhizobium sp. U87765 SZCCT0131]|uniref:hypothetical protein n=1 Tax=unclassified Bradyrhizobium TaxID=2631580 RepID=UPI001BA85E1F|nr:MULTISPECIES: hypothetical protein [unclassified Bradyrhizobium]MBR1217170.1 hypothetical protein [Bradyrhizobium sp. U87765 SZCCT0131]MBR1259074.1 hypothetical protein [Bradyrhizobium sp. U87765 SZCCT0134]MBR1305215.1 hypothetical protein [Bradyrhizobium sp. U87765 SZCCT0110]MBR1321001.1 hypothetical protein [Bradyrhizobium sp. U87765 SZCCT0109]MBR1350345.1 hypothetical protein [Bradyrhizobium sp. U87765 SZCCT0048]
MLRRAFSAAAIRTARKAAVTALAPLVEGSRTRLNGIPDSAWLDPYLVGFMVMLITITARRKVVWLQNEALCSVQSQAWHEITGVAHVPVGEETLLLDTARHRQFELGQQHALVLDRHLFGGAAVNGEEWHGMVGVDDVVSGDDVAGQIDRRVAVTAIWSDTFDAYVAQLPLAKPYP